MKLENSIKTDFSSTLQLEGVDAVISQEKISKMWDMLQAPYKNSIGSIVREITSNCFDSHAEAKVDDAVVINLNRDDSGYYIEFCDVGTGLSPERISKIYSKYLESTKEDSNDFIGAFGIGSKSPLSYTDVFFITTVSEGIQYEYMMRKGENSPRIEKLTETSINERNGTKIKIYMVDQSDVAKFAKECKKQLAYFDNVYINISHYINNVYQTDINNKYTVIEGKNFKFRNDYSPYEGLHISLGKVAYPIDWNNLGISGNRFQKLNIALKFEIGDLPVTFTREDIKYHDKSINTVKEKIKSVVEELTELYNKQDYVNKSHDYFDLSTMFYAGTYNDYRVGDLIIGDSKINLESIFHRTDLVSKDDFSTDITDFKIDSIKCNVKIKKLFCEEYRGLPFKLYNNTNKHNAFANHVILYKKIDPVNNSRVSNGSKSYGAYTPLNDIMNNKYPLVLNHDAKIETRHNRYISEVIYGQKLKDYIAKYPNKTPKQDYIYIVEIKKIGLKDYKYILGLGKSNKHLWRKLIVAYQKTIESSFLSNIINYSDFQAPDEWYKKWKKDNLTPTVKTKTTDQEFNLFKINDLLKDHREIQSTEGLRNIINLESYFQIIDTDYIKKLDTLYVSLHDDKVVLGNLKMLYELIKSKDKNTEFVTASKTNFEKLKKMSNVKLIDDFITDYEELIKDYYHANLLVKEMTNHNFRVYQRDNFTIDYQVELTYLEIFKPGFSGFIKEMQDSINKVNGFKDIDIQQLNGLNFKTLNFGIDLINRYLQSNDPKAVIIKKEGDKKFNDFKSVVRNNTNIIKKLQILKELQFGSTNYNMPIDNILKFRLLEEFDLIDPNCEIITMLNKNESITNIKDTLGKRLVLLSFYDNYTFTGNRHHSYSISTIVEEYKKYIGEKQRKDKLLQTL